MFNNLDPHIIIFARRLDEEMDRKGLSPEDFEFSGICSASTINGYLNHSHAPAIGIAISIAKYLGVGLDWLFGMDEDDVPTIQRRAPWLQ